FDAVHWRTSLAPLPLERLTESAPHVVVWLLFSGSTHVIHATRGARPELIGGSAACVAVDRHVHVVVVIGRRPAAVLHPAPALVRALGGRDLAGRDDLADAGLVVVLADPRRHRVAERAARHDAVQRVAGVVLTASESQAAPRG